jgi:hypothetical protein
MTTPLKHFHELSHSERRRIVISDLERDEMKTLYPQPEWCKHPQAIDNHLGCLLLLQGFIFDDSNVCKICENYKGE